MILVGKYYKENMTNFIVVVTYVNRKKNVVSVLYTDGSTESLAVDAFEEGFEPVGDENDKFKEFLVAMNEIERKYNGE